MGTANPHVTITAATRKGSGHTNRDRYITGPNFAAVLDGASNFSDEPQQQDGGWYAETLAAKLRELLTDVPRNPLPKIVEHAIEAVVTEHDLRPGTSPTSTIALARWDDEHVEIFVLGDSAVAIIHPDGSEDVYSDDRLASIGGGLRRAYRERLSAGSGFDDRHRQLLASLQREQAKWRNREDGYWIAGADAMAGRHALTLKARRTDVALLALATDGAAAGVVRYGAFASWKELGATAPESALDAVVSLESMDQDGVQWPRSKAVDDKTLMLVDFTQDAERVDSS